MHDPGAVRVGDRLCQDHEPLGGGSHGNESALCGVVPQPDRQVWPVAQLFDDVRQPAGLAELVDGNDVRMPQRGQRLGLAYEALLGFARKESFGPGDLEGDQASQPRIAGAKYGSRAAGAQPLEDLEATEDGLRQPARGADPRGAVRRALRLVGVRRPTGAHGMQRLERRHDLSGGCAELVSDLALEVPGRTPVEERSRPTPTSDVRAPIQIGLQGLRRVHWSFLVVVCSRTSARPHSLRTASGVRPTDSPISAYVLP